MKWHPKSEFSEARTAIPGCSCARRVSKARKGQTSRRNFLTSLATARPAAVAPRAAKISPFSIPACDYPCPFTRAAFASPQLPEAAGKNSNQNGFEGCAGAARAPKVLQNTFRAARPAARPGRTRARRRRPAPPAAQSPSTPLRRARLGAATPQTQANPRSPQEAPWRRPADGSAAALRSPRSSRACPRLFRHPLCRWQEQREVLTWDPDGGIIIRSPAPGSDLSEVFRTTFRVVSDKNNRLPQKRKPTHACPGHDAPAAQGAASIIHC